MKKISGEIDLNTLGGKGLAPFIEINKINDTINGVK
jgi:hypothetical protein